MSDAESADISAWRPNVGIVLFSASGRVFFGRRTATPGPHNWQFPQGGIDPGEAPRAAALRELEEETGAPPRLAQMLGELADWLSYDFPPEVRARKKNRNWRGQRQKWFAFRFLGADSDIDLSRSDEFEAWRWGDLAEAPGLIIPWKRPVYEQVVREFSRFAVPA